MKRLSSIILLIIAILSLSSCSNKETLLFLNWGEYIDEELIAKFEKEYNCTVVMDLADSNELFYSKVSAGTTVYDVVCPSDYMVIKMYNKGLLSEIDFSKLSYDPNSVDVRNGIKEVTKIMQDNSNDDIVNYFVPYLWGTWGIMYSTNKEGLEDAILGAENEWSCLFDRSILPAGTKVAMYDSYQHDYYALCRYLGYDVYEELPTSTLNKMKDIIKTMSFDAWGNDNIKKQIVAGNYDVGFMWTGDFLYYYCENIANIVTEAYINGEIDYTEFEDMINQMALGDEVYKSKKGKEYTIGFDLFIPKDTVAFCDNLVITKDSYNKDLAHKFIDFMTSYKFETEEEVLSPAFANTYYVCYDAPLISVYKEILSLKDEIDYSLADIEKFKEQKDDPFDSDLYWSFYDYATSIAFSKYYPENEFKGSILATFERNYVSEISRTFNNAKV